MVTQENIKEEMFDSGLLKASDVCTDAYKAGCDKLGIELITDAGPAVPRRDRSRRDSAAVLPFIGGSRAPYNVRARKKT